MTGSNTTTEIMVAGTGPAGLIAALAVAKSGLEVKLVGPPANLDDRRTTTLMMPALEYLSSLLDTNSFLSKAAALKTMRIIDATGRLVRSPTVSFHAAEAGENQFGFNIPNAELNAALHDAVLGNGKISVIENLVERWELTSDHATAHLSDGTMINAKLVVAADGRESPARKAAGIDCRDNPYPQSALVLMFDHSRPHQNISTEFHTEYGPFTQVPLPGNRSSLVWVLPPTTAAQYLEMDTKSLSRMVEDKMQSMLGKVSVDEGRQLYPLTSRIPNRFAAKRVVLIGEAAHVFPPIGAQGLNLGVRDVSDLQECLNSRTDDPGSESVLSAYHRKRLPDVTSRAGSVHMLNSSLLSSMLPAQVARAAGLSMLNSIPPLRNLAMLEGMNPGSGFRALFGSLREQVRR